MGTVDIITSHFGGGALVGVSRSIALAMRRNLPDPARGFLKSLLRNMGYEPARRGPIDFRGLPLTDPLLAWTQGGGRQVLVDVPLERVRILELMGFSCAPGAPNPFVATVRGILDGSAKDYASSPLRRYYEGFTPLNPRTPCRPGKGRQGPT